MSWFTILLQFALHASNPSWSCSLTHRDPDVAGTYYLYCSQLAADGVEDVTVGKFVADARSTP